MLKIISNSVFILFFQTVRRIAFHVKKLTAYSFIDNTFLILKLYTTKNIYYFLLNKTNFYIMSKLFSQRYYILCIEGRLKIN